MYQLIDSIDYMWKRPCLKDTQLAKIVVDHREAIEKALRDGATASLECGECKASLDKKTLLTKSNAIESVIWRAPNVCATVTLEWSDHGKPLKRPLLPLARGSNGKLYPLEMIQIRKPLQEYVKECSTSEMTKKIQQAEELLKEALIFF